MGQKRVELSDFGRLVKPKVLTEAFLRCKTIRPIDPHEWWNQVNNLSFRSKTYKQDTIIGTYGQGLNTLFSDLNIDTYVGSSTSLVIFHAGEYSFIDSPEKAKKILEQKNRRYHIRAVGLKLYKDYDPKTRQVGQVWEPTNNPSVVWYYKMRHVIPIEDVEQYNSLSVGDMIAFKKTQALVVKVKSLKRHKFYNYCSWTSKKITVLSGSQAHQVRMLTNRPYQIIKRPEASNDITDKEVTSC